MLRILISFQIIFVSLLTGWFSNLAAQNPELPDEQVEVIANFEAKLQESQVLDIKPSLPEVKTEVKSLEYQIPQRIIEVSYPAPRIRPLAMRRERPDPVYNGYLKAGAGIPNAFAGELGYHLAPKGPFSLDIGANHYSANNKKVDNQRFSKNNFNARGTYFFDEGFAVSGRAGYTLDKVHYYGYTQDERFRDTFFTKEDVEQRFTIVDLGASLFNGDQTIGSVNYGADADVYFMEDNYAARESGFDLKLHMTKWFNDRHPLTVRIRTDFNTFKDTTTQSLHNFYLQPSFTWHHDLFRVRFGLNLMTHNDEYFAFPDVEAAVPILGSRLAAFIGAGGSLQKNTMRTLANYNPFVSTRTGLVLENSNYIDYYAGVKGSFSGVEYLAKAGLRQTENLALFVPNYSGIEQTIVPYDFIVRYDDGDIFFLNASVSAPLFGGLSIMGDLTSNIYDMKTEEAAWHLPALTFQGTVKYETLEGRAMVKASVFVENGVPYPTGEGIKENLNGLFDLNVGASYFLTDHLGLFLDLYNLANNKRQRWYNYPTYGLNVIGGVTARF